VTFGLGSLPWFFATLSFQFPISGRLGLIIFGRPGGTPVWPVTSTGLTAWLETAQMVADQRVWTALAVTTITEQER
jgi:hypothetical protein